MGSPGGLGATARGAGTQRAQTQPLRQAAGGRGRAAGAASVTNEKLSRYLKEVYLAQMLGLL